MHYIVKDKTLEQIKADPMTTYIDSYGEETKEKTKAQVHQFYGNARIARETLETRYPWLKPIKVIERD